MLVRTLCAAAAAAVLASPLSAQQSPDWTACFASQDDPDGGIRGCTAIIVAGRLIAYNWFDCDIPQSAFIQRVAGCTTADQ